MNYGPKNPLVGVVSGDLALNFGVRRKDDVDLRHVLQRRVDAGTVGQTQPDAVGTVPKAVRPKPKDLANRALGDLATLHNLDLVVDANGGGETVQAIARSLAHVGVVGVPSPSLGSNLVRSVGAVILAGRVGAGRAVVDLAHAALLLVPYDGVEVGVVVIVRLAKAEDAAVEVAFVVEFLGDGGGFHSADRLNTFY